MSKITIIFGILQIILSTISPCFPILKMYETGDILQNAEHWSSQF